VGVVDAVLERCPINALYSINSSAVEEAETRTDVLGNGGLLERFVSAGHAGHSWDVQIR
jgi:hypothetical protein